MTNENKAPVAAHYEAVAADYHKQYQAENLRTLEKYPANFFRLRLLKDRVEAFGAKRVYEVGVGEGSPLIAMAGLGCEVAGCDVTEAMVEQCQKHFEREGLDPGVIQWADIEDASTFSNQLEGGPFDVVIAAGVLPHISDDSVFITNIKKLVRPGGKVFIEFRNKMFSLFTFNRFTKEFIMDDLLGDVDENIRAIVAEDLDARIAIDQPKRRMKVGDKAPGYDAIPARFHNPLELQQTFAEHGLINPVFHWYHFHPMPPMLEGKAGDNLREEMIRLESHSSDWRGMFLCSAGVLEADLA